MLKNKKQFIETSDVPDGEGLHENGSVRRIGLKGEHVVPELEDQDTAEIFSVSFAPDLEPGAPFREFTSKVAPEIGDDKLTGGVDVKTLNTLLKGKPCQFIVARKPGAGGKARLEVVLVLPPKTLTHVTKAA